MGPARFSNAPRGVGPVRLKFFFNVAPVRLRLPTPVPATSSHAVRHGHGHAPAVRRGDSSDAPSEHRMPGPAMGAKESKPVTDFTVRPWDGRRRPRGRRQRDGGSQRAGCCAGPFLACAA